MSTSPERVKWRFGEFPDQCAAALLLGFIAFAVYAAGYVYTSRSPGESMTVIYAIATIYALGALWHGSVAALMFRGRALSSAARFGPAAALLLLIPLRFAWVFLIG